MADLDGRHRIQGLVHRKAVTVHAEATLRDVAEVLAGDVIGVVLVRGADGSVVGIISERDLVRALADSEEIDVVRADAIMSEDLVTIDRGAEVGVAAQLMLDSDIRHLVVTDHGEPFAIASARDILAAYTHGEV